jgi:hypothetical protein
MVREQALLGYAVTLETMSDGDTTEAVAAYEKLLEEFPDSRLKGYAADRAASLKTGGAQDFYAWFHQLNPKPPERPGPQDQLRLPDGSDLSNLLQELGGSGIPLSTPASGDEEPEGAASEVNPFAAEEMQDDAAPADGDAAPDAAPASDETAKPQAEGAADTTADDPRPAPQEPAPADTDASGDTPAETDAPAEDEADAPSE